MRGLPSRSAAFACLAALSLLAGCDWGRPPGGSGWGRSRPATAAAASGASSESAVSHRLELARRLETAQRSAAGVPAGGCENDVGRMFDNSRERGCLDSNGVWAGGAGKVFPAASYTDPSSPRGAAHGPPPSPWTAQRQAQAEGERLRSRLLLSGWTPGVVDAIFLEASRQQVDPFLIAAVTQQESSGNAFARSPAGAQGAMQLMPGTVREMGVRDPWNPYQNVRGGVAYLKQQFDSFSDISLAAFSALDPSRREDVHRALMAYNGGPGAALEAMSGRSHRLSQETLSYPYQVLRHWEEFRREAAASP